MIITDYYLFEKLSNTRSATRFDCTISTASHPELESLKNPKGELFVYYVNVPVYFKGDVKRRADKCLTNRLGKNLSSLFVPDITKPTSYGDIAHTRDAILVRCTPDMGEPTKMELFVCRGQKNNWINLYNLFVDGELKEDIEELKQRLPK